MLSVVKGLDLPKKLGLGGFITSAMGILIGWGAFPPILRSQIGKVKGLAPGTEMREFWEKAPFTLDFSVYVFNVTNAEEVQQSGAIPVVQEIGPFVFDEYKEKSAIVDYEEDDTVAFHMKNTYIFNDAKSAPLTMNENIVIIHPLIAGIAGATERQKASAVKMVEGALPKLFNNPESVFLKTTPFDVFFRGMFMNCTSRDFQSMAICAILKKEIKDLQQTEWPNVLKYSILNGKNGTDDPNILRISRGILNPQKVGELVSVNEKDTLPYWKGRPCNDIVGTDSTVFPPGLKPGEDVWSYSVEICRSLGGKYVGESMFNGVRTYRYTVELGDMTSDPEFKCLCPSENFCLKKGTMDLLSCTGAPVMASLPHFYGADEEYQRGVIGLHPEKEKHEIVFELEPFTGTPVYAKKRLMFSFPMHKIKNFHLSNNLPSTVIPLFWVEESLELNDEFAAKLDSDLFRILRLVDVMRWSSVFAGAVTMVSAVGLHYKRRKALSVTPKQEAPTAEDNKKPQTMELDEGHTNYGYI